MRGKNIIWMSFAFMMALSALLAFPAYAPTTASVYLDPATVAPEVGDTITINIKIADVTDLYTWGLRLYWNPILLDEVSATEGTFLSASAPEGTFFIVGAMPPDHSYLDLACSILGNYPGVTGSGTLATVTFFVRDLGVSTIDLTDVSLLDSGINPIPSTAADSGVDTHSDWISEPNFYCILVEKRIGSHHWSLSIHGTLLTFYGKNKNEWRLPLYTRVVFTGMAVGKPYTVRTNIAQIVPNDVSDFLTYGQALTAANIGAWNLQVYVEYSYGGYLWFVNKYKVEDLNFDIRA